MSARPLARGHYHVEVIDLDNDRTVVRTRESTRREAEADFAKEKRWVLSGKLVQLVGMRGDKTGWVVLKEVGGAVGMRSERAVKVGARAAKPRWVGPGRSRARDFSALVQADVGTVVAIRGFDGVTRHFTKIAVADGPDHNVWHHADTGSVASNDLGPYRVVTGVRAVKGRRAGTLGHTQALPPGTTVGGGRWPYGHGKPWKGVVLAVDDPRAWHGTMMAGLGNKLPTQAKVNAHLRQLAVRGVDVGTGDNDKLKVPVLWYFDSGTKSHWDSVATSPTDKYGVKPWQQDVAQWKRETAVSGLPWGTVRQRFKRVTLGARAVKRVGRRASAINIVKADNADMAWHIAEKQAGPGSTFYRQSAERFGFRGPNGTFWIVYDGQSWDAKRGKDY